MLVCLVFLIKYRDSSIKEAVYPVLGPGKRKGCSLCDRSAGTVVK